MKRKRRIMDESKSGGTGLLISLQTAFPQAGGLEKSSYHWDRGNRTPYQRERKTGNFASIFRSLECNATLFASAVRNHWGIENSLCTGYLMWLFGKMNAVSAKTMPPQNLAIIRHFAQNSLEKMKNQGKGCRCQYKTANSGGWDNEYLTKVLSGWKKWDNFMQLPLPPVICESLSRGRMCILFNLYRLDQTYSLSPSAHKLFCSLVYFIFIPLCIKV